MYSPPLSREQVEKQLSQYQKINYNQFRWWRMYQPKNKPLDNRKPLRERIFNGDFDFSCYKAQIYWCEHQLNDTLEDFVKLDELGQQKYSLGAGLFKLRISSKSGRGKSSGSRSILAFKSNDRTIWLHLFDSIPHTSAFKLK